MKCYSLCSVLALRSIIFSLLSFSFFAWAKPPPNILFIVADDLGYSDVGAFGGEIKTPALDQLAAEGLRLGSFHVLPTCSPTRSVLFSGVDNHLAGLGTMGEALTPEMVGKPGYEGHLNFEIAALPELLQDGGYRTYLAGKWHLGDTDETVPFARGFEQTFALLPAGGSHWSDKAPLSPSMPMVYTRNGEVIDQLPESFYSTRYFTDVMLEWLRQSERDEKPFFAFLSYMAPHNPLHAPKNYIDKYKGKYDIGWDELRKQRIKGLQKLGLVESGVEAFPRLPHILPWKDLPEQQKRFSARDMEVYAAMIDFMDEQILRVVDYLKTSGQYENTVIVFMSDNGANGSPQQYYPGQTEAFLKTFDNSLDNRGLKYSYVDMGPGWAQASTGPSSLFKGAVTEGGTLSPLIFKLPGKRSNAGAVNTEFVSVRDIMPTLLDIAGIDHGEKFKARSVLPMQGASLLPLLLGETDKAYTGADQLGMELFGGKAYTAWPWKILKLPPHLGEPKWQLFNLREDPGETTDLSKKHPEIASSLLVHWRQYAISNKILNFEMEVPADIRKIR